MQSAVKAQVGKGKQVVVGEMKELVKNLVVNDQATFNRSNN
jgi:hypothetical protein